MTTTLLKEWNNHRHFRKAPDWKAYRLARSAAYYAEIRRMARENRNGSTIFTCPKGCAL